MAGLLKKVLSTIHTPVVTASMITALKKKDICGWTALINVFTHESKGLLVRAGRPLVLFNIKNIISTEVFKY